MTNNANLLRVRYVISRRNRQLHKLRHLQDRVVDARYKLSRRETAVFTAAKAHDVRVKYTTGDWKLYD